MVNRCNFSKCRNFKKWKLPRQCRCKSNIWKKEMAHISKSIQEFQKLNKSVLEESKRKARKGKRWKWKCKWWKKKNWKLNLAYIYNILGIKKKNCNTIFINSCTRTHVAQSIHRHCIVSRIIFIPHLQSVCISKTLSPAQSCAEIGSGSLAGRQLTQSECQQLDSCTLVVRSLC